MVIDLKDKKLCVDVICTILNGDCESIPHDLSCLLKDEKLNIEIPNNLEFVYNNYVLYSILTGHEIDFNLLHSKLEKLYCIKDLHNLDEYVMLFSPEREKRLYYKNIDRDNISDLVNNDMYIIAMVNMYSYMNKRLINLEGRLSYIKKINNIE